jgi:hypothetical protein
MTDDEYDAWLNDAVTAEADPYNPYFDRQGRQLPDMGAWIKLVGEPDYKRIALTTVGRIHVSTIWTGMDMGWAEDGGPIIFETMTFARRKRDRRKPFAVNRWCERYATETEARKGHEKIVNAIRARGATAIWSKKKEQAWHRAWSAVRMGGL